MHRLSWGINWVVIIGGLDTVTMPSSESGVEGGHVFVRLTR